MTSIRVVISPDSFKGTASATEVAAAMSSGWRDIRPDDTVICLPMADGGEGTIEALGGLADARLNDIEVTGPDDAIHRSRWLEFTSGDGARTGLVELANTSGITLLRELRPLTAHTRGFGQAIRAALDAGVDRLLLAVGSSASSDGGMGALAELGVLFLDENGMPVGDGNQALGNLRSVDFSHEVAPPAGGAIILSDVTNPLLGDHGAVRVFGVQKGITSALADAAEDRMALFARVVSDSTGADPLITSGGAAGGTAFGLMAWGAQTRGGAHAVAQQIGLDAAIASADLVVTGEGRYDVQSEAGKVPSYVRTVARSHGSRVALVVGSTLAPPHDFDDWVSLTDLAGTTADAMSSTELWLREAGRELARSVNSTVPR